MTTVEVTIDPSFRKIRHGARWFHLEPGWLITRKGSAAWFTDRELGEARDNGEQVYLRRRGEESIGTRYDRAWCAVWRVERDEEGQWHATLT